MKKELDESVTVPVSPLRRSDNIFFEDDEVHHEDNIKFSLAEDITEDLDEPVESWGWINNID